MRYSHLLGQINCTVGIGWLSTLNTQLCCFLSCLGSGISVMLFIWQPVWTNNLSRTLLGFMKDRQLWNPFPELWKTMCRQPTASRLSNYRCSLVYSLMFCMSPQGFGDKVRDGSSSNCCWKQKKVTVSVACCSGCINSGVEHDKCTASPRNWCWT